MLIYLETLLEFNLVNAAGWIPAIILPAATITQLIKILRSRSVEGVSIISWFLFAIANLGLYVFTEKYTAIQSIIGLLFTGILDLCITGILLFRLKYNQE